MACGKGNANQPIEDFIVHSPAPVDVAAKMSAIYNELSFKVNKEFFDTHFKKVKMLNIELKLNFIQIKLHHFEQSTQHV